MDENPYRAPESQDPVPAVRSAPPNCPNCGLSMQAGYLRGGGVYWRSWGETQSSFSLETPLPGSFGILRNPQLSGYRCEDCELIIFRYGQNRDAYAAG